MNAAEFRKKWQRSDLKERAAAQEHFLDLCALVGHPTPAEDDPSGERFTFERGAKKTGGGDGWADVWKRGFFGWEYKGKHKDLDAAYVQLLTYREALENPPLLVVCDMDRILIHTNFTNTPTTVHQITLENLDDPKNMDILRAVFFHPEKLKPGATSQTITVEAASSVASIAQSLRDRGVDALSAARFLDRVVFCLFAEDIGLLPERLFTQLLEKTRHDPGRFARLVEQLFGAMAAGGDFGVDTIRRFDGHLFDDVGVIELTEPEIQDLYQAALLDWSAVDPSILGTLFERGLDPQKRSQLGAHFTSREDIELLVEPVVMKPLREEWEETRRIVTNLLTTGKKSPSARDRAKPPGPRVAQKARLEADIILHGFLQRLAGVKVLDPACGSGNFLYVTLQKLKDLEKEIIVWAMEQEMGGFFPMVGPWQLHGIEINPYAFELAQMTVWIGYLQWVHSNGFGFPPDPVLQPMRTFELKDAVADLSDPENPAEPQWPAVDFIVGNPPFLGGKLLRRELGDTYVDRLFAVWDGRVPKECDLCCYWLEKARSQVERGLCGRAGLLATQGIRGGANRKVLERIKASGDIFFAVSDRPWILEGAAVHISMVGFDGGREPNRTLDGRPVAHINADLTATVNVTTARRLPDNRRLSYMGDTKGGKFELTEEEALRLLHEPNPNGRPTSDVLVPWINGLDITRRPRSMWIVDFGIGMAEEEAARYEAAFRIVRERVWPARSTNRRETYRRLWWQHVEARPKMRGKLASLDRFIITARVAKHRLFVWCQAPVLADSQVIVVALRGDFSFGVLHSRVHEVWARAQGTQVRERESGFRYTPSTCFETFPFPDPTPEQREAIAEAARELDRLRSAWLDPPEWTREEILEFPGSADGPWARWVEAPDQWGIGTVRWPRTAPRDARCAERLARRTLTNLYNQRPPWLELAHRRLDQAVLGAYGWPEDFSGDEILARLLELNLAPAATAP